MPIPSEIIALLDRFLKGESLSVSEKAQLKIWFFDHGIVDQTEAAFFSDPEWEKEFSAYLALINNRSNTETGLHAFVQKAGFDENQISENSVKGGAARVRSIFSRWSWVAASVVLVLGAAAYFLLQNRYTNSQLSAGSTANKQLIAPGKNGAILTLADGSQIVLDSLGNGSVITDQGVEVVVKNGNLVYNTSESSGGAIPTYHTASTPVGRQFHLTLPDGTGVWLNASSSIRFPTAFSESERRVDITGEAYFEVAKMAGKPFRVGVSDRAEVEVLGTSFNVNAYSDEQSISTTLIEGAVKVKPLVGREVAEGVRLDPGQQAQIIASGNRVSVIENADIDKIMAWKNGLFNFNNTDFVTAMRQLERWYDIKVIYENGQPNDIELYGSITRDVTLNDLLIGLQKIGVKCRLDGKNLVILK